MEERDRSRGERLEDANVVFRRRDGGEDGWWTRCGVRSLEAAFHGSILGVERANGIHGSAHHAETLSAVVAYFNIAFEIVIDRDLSTRENALIRAFGQRFETRTCLSITDGIEFPRGRDRAIESLKRTSLVALVALDAFTLSLAYAYSKFTHNSCSMSNAARARPLSDVYLVNWACIYACGRLVNDKWRCAKSISPTLYLTALPASVLNSKLISAHLNESLDVRMH